MNWLNWIASIHWSCLIIFWTMSRIFSQCVGLSPHARILNQRCIVLQWSIPILRWDNRSTHNRTHTCSEKSFLEHFKSLTYYKIDLAVPLNSSQYWSQYYCHISQCSDCTFMPINGGFESFEMHNPSSFPLYSTIFILSFDLDFIHSLLAQILQYSTQWMGQ